MFIVQCSFSSFIRSGLIKFSHDCYTDDTINVSLYGETTPGLSRTIIPMTKTTAVRKEVAFNYHKVRTAQAIFSGICFCGSYILEHSTLI